MTWGMPLPSDPGKKRRVSQTHIALMAGVTSNGSHRYRVAYWTNSLYPKSISPAYATATSPTATAPSQNTP